MCGILGALVWKGKRIGRPEFRAALDLMTHRGPDESGIYVEEGVLLGHRRLSIIDLSDSGTQPMFSVDGKVGIIYNGEIYNYKSLRKTLSAKGYVFRTASDTEVLIAGYQMEGMDFLSKLDGMFAFALLDLSKRKIFLVRDRFGIKPLFYKKDEDRIIFASELKSIISLSESADFSINSGAVSSYFSYRYPIYGDSFWNEVDQIDPGHLLTLSLDHGDILRERYYALHERILSNGRLNMSMEEHVDALEEKLETAVARRMISDVPFGAFLSGGLDSSLITALMAKRYDGSVRTYTIGFNEDGYNEFDYSRMVADAYGCTHSELRMDSNRYVDNMKKLIWYKDAPLSVPNEVPLYEMSRKLKEDITVVLSGEGADEAFGGYGRIFRSPFDFERSRSVTLLDDSSDVFTSNYKGKYGSRIFDDLAAHFYNVYSYNDVAAKKLILDGSVVRDDAESSFMRRFATHLDEVDQLEDGEKYMYLFHMVHLPGLLRRLDCSSMAASVEARVPFVSHHVIEHAYSIPFEYKLRWKPNGREDSSDLISDQISEKYDVPKYILKKVSERHLPHDVIYRRKMGFPVPLDTWLSSEFGEFCHDILLSKRAVERGLYNRKGIEGILTKSFGKGEMQHGMKIWMAVSLELYLTNIFDNGA